ncbi:MAG: PKD domain-containing protein [Bacteroidales bacterium]|nr:PKD domain-containing protein [Bacteroidales bacterium]
MKRFTILFMLAFVLMPGLNMQAQVSHGGSPYSMVFQLADEYQHINLQQPDMKSIHDEDLINDADRGPAPRRMGVSVVTDLNTHNAGTWTAIPGLGKVWRLQIEIKEALALGVYYSDFYLPEGGELFLYNANKKQILGAYTHENNPTANLFSTEFVQGDKVTLEYFQPETVAEEARIHISELAYAYRDIDFSFSSGEREAWWCMIDVACSEGDNWQNQIKGAARISIKIGFNYYWCSGSLINNTDNDRKNYFLTASHCGGSANAGDLNQWIFYFNYEAATCGGSASGYNSKTGCSLKAKDPSQADAGSDFYLVEINGSIPNSYDVFYNGWNRTNDNTEADSGVGIHHPAGDIKKISTYKTPLQSSTFWNGIPGGTHWKLLWAETENGKSIMQGGSSGSPVFDEYGRIMGDLTGGYTSNSCTNPSPAYYGKLWYSWDKNGTTPSTQLKGWLDPENTGIEKLPGISWEIILPTADFSADTTELIQGDTAWFTDESEPGIMAWSWNFDGALPDTSSERNPWTIYSDTGYFDVSLKVVNADGEDSTMKTAYIHVNQLLPPDAQFTADITEIQAGETIHFSDTSANEPTSWYWEFEGGSPPSSTQQNPAIRFNSAGAYDIKLVATNLGGSDSLVKEEYILVGWVGVEELAGPTDFRVYPNPGTGIFVLEFSSDINEPLVLEVSDTYGKLIRRQTLENLGKTFVLDLSRENEGVYFVKTISGNRQAVKKVSLVK